MADPAYKPKVRDLAARIYTNLLDRSVSVTPAGVKMDVSAQNLAELSFKLADAFQAVEDGLNAENMPKNPTFKLGVEDIAEWSKTA